MFLNHAGSTVPIWRGWVFYYGLLGSKICVYACGFSWLYAHLRHSRHKFERVVKRKCVQLDLAANWRDFHHFSVCPHLTTLSPLHSTSHWSIDKLAMNLQRILKPFLKTLPIALHSLMNNQISFCVLKFFPSPKKETSFSEQRRCFPTKNAHLKVMNVLPRVQLPQKNVLPENMDHVLMVLLLLVMAKGRKTLAVKLRHCQKWRFSRVTF